MEFEWNIFPGFNTLQLSEEVKRLLLRLDETPENCTGRIKFMTMFNDINCGSKDNEQECLANAKLVSLYARRFGKGQWSFIGPGSEKKWYCISEDSPQGEWDNMAERMLLEFAESGCPIFRVTSPLSRGRLRSKGHGKLSIHYAADLETIETIFRIIVSANQLSLHGAIAEICEEYETLHERTGRPVVETSVIQARSSEDSKDPNVGKAHERTRRLVIETNTENVPDSSQTRSCHESETFNAGDKTLRERTVRPVVDHDNLSHEQTMLNEANMDFRIPGLPHSVVKHAQSTSVRELVQKIENHPSDTLFNKIYDKIKHITHLAQNQRK